MGCQDAALPSSAEFWTGNSLLGTRIYNARYLLRLERGCVLSFALSDHGQDDAVLVPSVIIPIESAKTTEHPYRCRITRRALDTRG